MSGLGLLADYGSSNSSSEDSEEDADKPVPNEANSPVAAAASDADRPPLPSFTTELQGTSIFANPFREAEDARRAVLEKHVKLTTQPTDLRQINGKQVCWNYRKGRCRFGRGCKFAHDSDLQGAGAGAGGQEPEAEEAPAEAPEVSTSALGAPPDGEPPRKKRPGLSQTLVPGKKVKRMFQRTHKGPLV